MKNDIDLFMYAYMYELENYLNSFCGERLNLNRQVDEANTDKTTKEFLKDIMLNKVNSLNNSKLTKLTVNGETFAISSINSFFIKDIMLQDQLTDYEKEIIKKSKNSVYTNPDLFLKISDSTGNIKYKTVEVKSTKNDKIPGSSVQQISPDEWTIFLLEKGGKVKFSTSLYINAIDKKIQFPDRSPRPEVSFNEVSNWNDSFRISNKNEITYLEDKSVEEKELIINDWQKHLANEWSKVLFAKGIEKSPPWFHNALRKFILVFLNIYENLSQKEKNDFKNNINKNIK